ncbi:Peptidase C19 ubiquitin carboxyl-terminal hydrolase [Trinorchestia longiramus]|nr:Peptidase C19 ubiquitin carboxyl-terminal hydrolase [Trinorchestia longiramus]
MRLEVISRLCPYLDTINRHMLDFDFEKLCSISLSRINVYACLVCGKYFQGRGNNTHAYTHSVSDDHHVFLNLQSLRFYCLPDNYEIIGKCLCFYLWFLELYIFLALILGLPISLIGIFSLKLCDYPSLADIIYLVNPTFTKEWIKQPQTKMSRAYDKSMYLPGIVGLNNIKANDYCNVVLQVLSNITPLRNYFLFPENYGHISHPPGSPSLAMFPLITRFGELVRKLWNPRNFKAHVSPHEMLQAVVSCSKKRFQFTVQGDAIQFLSWILNAMHLGLKTDSCKSTIISKCFRGSMVIKSKKLLPVDASAAELRRLQQQPEYQMREETSKFFYLTCDLPLPPLFKDEKQENIIPQINLLQLLSKFDGKTEKEYQTYKENVVKVFQLSSLPPFLILYHKRFTKNTFYVEKNPTIVNFPVRNVELAEYLTDEVSYCLTEVVSYCLTEVVSYCLTEVLRARVLSPLYDLVANIVHDGQPDSGTYRCHVLHKGTGKWYELQDLHVKEIEPQMLALSESYIQIYELQKESVRRPKDIDPQDACSMDLSP